MEQEGDQSLPVIAVTAAVGAVVILFMIVCNIFRRDKTEFKKEEDVVPVSNGAKAPPQAQQKKQKFTHRQKKEARNFTHPWLAGTLKGHSSLVLGLDVSPNGKYLASCAEDRTVLLWSSKEFANKEHKSIRANVDLDHATKVRFSPDSRNFIVSLGNGNAIRVFKIGKKDDGSAGSVTPVLDFDQKHTAEIINIGISSNGKFIMSCHRDTTLLVWDLKGEVLARVDSHQMNNAYGAVSPCGRFIASSGFTPDVKVWEVIFTKTGDFSEVKRAFDLKGHSAGVYHFDFSNDTSKMATVSKDGTWKLWKTDVEYQKNQDPYLLLTGQFEHSGPGLIALCPFGRTVAVSQGSDIYVFSAVTGQQDVTIEEAHTAPINALAFDVSSKYLVSTGDRHIHAFHNITGYRATIEELELSKKTAKNPAHRQRLQQQMDAARESLKNILGEES